MDDADLDFQLNAAIESNPFQKKRINKAPATQPTEAPKTQAATTLTTAQRPSENIQPKETTALGYKKPTYPETIKSNTEIPKKEEIPSSYQRPTYPATTQAQSQQLSAQPEPGKIGTTPYTQTPAYRTPMPANITRATPTTIQKEPVVSHPEKTTPIVTAPRVPTNPVQTSPLTQLNKPELTKPSTTTPYTQAGLNREVQPSSTERPPFTSALGSLTGSTQVNKPSAVPYTQGGLNKEVQPTQNERPPFTSALGSLTGSTQVNKPSAVPYTQGGLNKEAQPTQNERPPIANALGSLTGQRPITQPVTSTIQASKPDLTKPTTVPQTQGTLNKETQPPVNERPPTVGFGGSTLTPPISKPSTVTTTQPPQVERPPISSALDSLTGQRPPTTVQQNVTQPKPDLGKPATTAPTQGVLPTQPPQNEKPPIASALGSLTGQKETGGLAVKTTEKEKQAIPTFTPPPTKTLITPIPRASPTKLISPTPIAQTQPSTLLSRVKQDPVTQSKELTKMGQTPKKMFASFNNNRGFMLVGSKVGRGRTIDVQTTRLGGLIQDALSYPGPYKFDKKSLGENKPELARFLEKKLQENHKSLPYRLSLELLNEYLNNSPNIFGTQNNSQSKEKIAQGLYNYINEHSLNTISKEYKEFFTVSNNYLSDLNNPSIEETSGEDLLFKALFLRNTAFNVDPVNIDYILHYVKSRFAPGDPLHTVSMVKLGLFHEIFETEFFIEGEINDLWPMWIYPCLRYSNFLPANEVRDFLNSFALKILERKNGNRNGMVSLFVAMLSGDFDLETFDKIIQSSRNLEFAQVLESYYYVLKAANPNYDKNYDVIPKILPLVLRYTSALVDLGMFERAKEYLDYIINLRPFYRGLEGNSQFLSQVRTIRDFIVNNYTLIEEAKAAAQKQTNFLGNIANKKEIATNTIKNIQAKGKGLFGFMSSALSNFINTNEAANASDVNPDDERKQVNTASTSVSDSLFSTATKPEVITKGKVETSPQPETIQVPQIQSPTHDFQPEEGGESLKVDPTKQGKNFMSNPFASKVGAPTATTAAAGGQGDNSSTRKGIPKNRYVSAL